MTVVKRDFRPDGVCLGRQVFEDDHPNVEFLAQHLKIAGSTITYKWTQHRTDNTYTEYTYVPNPNAVEPPR